MPQSTISVVDQSSTTSSTTTTIRLVDEILRHTQWFDHGACLAPSTTVLQLRCDYFETRLA